MAEIKAFPYQKKKKKKPVFFIFHIGIIHKLSFEQGFVEI